MLVRLTRNQRKKAGWIIAWVYLLCIMAPTLSYAAPGKDASSHCMTMKGAATGSMHDHDQSDPTILAHGHGTAHDHAQAQPAAIAGDDYPSIAMPSEDPSPQKGPHTTSGQCCVLMCIGTMPAPLLEITSPSIPTVVRMTTSYRATADNAPDVHYRPPIA
ncbi:hypothetical protein E0H22_03205 [Rhodopseudomonas boonkerdii]|uniref:hypothetical protein n=1 Tax=Rhodopseudomonas boonkerdii TaxID=475937 RepID=UPI001E57DCD6|nr:hypothetical protein [Rhodopseudomonas boonkerdii]UGV24774.1 hypothetical protein E0H22_03205 [Rhodopseudomonas boonkerdii]